MIRHAVGLAVVAALALAVTPARAQLIGPIPPGSSVRAPGDQPLDLPVRAPFSITPSVTIAEEYNDNILLNNRDKRWDMITSIIPAIAVTAESTTYRLLAAYNFRADFYARDSSRNEAFDRHALVVDGLYRVSPALSFTLSESFFFTTDTNLISQEGVSTGRSTSWSNSLTPGMTYQFDRLNSLRAIANYTVLRYQNSTAFDSDVYRLEPSFDHVFSPRLTGTLGYRFGYFDVKQLGTAVVNTPIAGASYRFTSTLTGTLAGGPSFVHDNRTGEDRVTPAILATATQRLPFGAASVVYERVVGTAGGFGGVTDNQQIGGLLRVTTLMKGLSVEVAPRYTIAESTDNAIDVRAFTMPLRVSYQFNRYITAVAGYQFFHQRVSGTLQNIGPNLLGNDVDQNRVTIGLQFGYPISIQ